MRITRCLWTSSAADKEFFSAAGKIFTDERRTTSRVLLWELRRQVTANQRLLSAIVEKHYSFWMNVEFEMKIELLCVELDTTKRITGPKNIKL